MTYPLEKNMDVFQLMYCICSFTFISSGLVQIGQVPSVGFFEQGHQGGSNVSLHLAPKYHHKTSPYPKHAKKKKIFKNANWDWERDSW